MSTAAAADDVINNSIKTESGDREDILAGTGLSSQRPQHLTHRCRNE